MAGAVENQPRLADATTASCPTLLVRKQLVKRMPALNARHKNRREARAALFAEPIVEFQTVWTWPIAVMARQLGDRPSHNALKNQPVQISESLHQGGLNMANVVGQLFYAKLLNAERPQQAAARSESNGTGQGSAG